MDNEPVFKSALFGGFDRQSVMDYIYELGNEAKEAQNRLKSQLADVSATREKLTSTVQELEKKLKDSEEARKNVTGDLSGERSRNSELGQMLEKLESEIKRQNEIIAEKDELLRRAEERAAELEKKNAEMESKRREVEKVSVYVGELVVRARAEAEGVLTEANNRAREIVENAYEALDGVFEQFSLFRTEMEAVESTLKDALDSMQQKFAQISNTVNLAEENVRGIYRPKNSLTLVTAAAEDSTPAPDEQPDFFRDSSGQ